MTPHTTTLVQHSWSQVLPIAPQAAALFYVNLFKLDPTLQPLFKGDMAAQGQRLMQMIGAAVNQIDRLDVLLPVLQGLGRRHAGYGVQPGHYATVGTALLQTLAQGLGDGFTPEAEAAWTEAYGVIASNMIAAAEPAPAAPQFSGAGTQGSELPAL
jgi:hemoglobin-like flavoprotein